MLFARQPMIEMQEMGASGSLVVMRYPLPGTGTFVVALPIFFVILFAAAHIWTQKMEPQFGLITKHAETIMFGKTEGLSASALPTRQPLRQD